MKKLAITMAVALLHTGLMAAPAEGFYGPSNNIRTEVVDQIGVPDLNQLNIDEDSVDIRFFVDENGKIQLRSVQGSSDELRSYVAEKLKYSEVASNDYGTNKWYDLKLIFKSK